VGWSQILFGALLVALLLGVAGFYAWRQVVLLRRLRGREGVPTEEDEFLRRQAWRRLINSGLMLVMAGLLAGLLVCFEGRAQELAEERDAFAVGEAPRFTPEQEHFVHVYTGLWIALLLVLLAVLGMAAADLWATRGYARRQFRKLQADRRAMIERQVARLRTERNGH
jgi:uncharacterized iron-regulated membrane protein